MARSVVTEFENYVKLNKKVSPEVLGTVTQIDMTVSPPKLIVGNMEVDVSDVAAVAN